MLDANFDLIYRFDFFELVFFFFKQKTAYEITYGDWSSDCALPISPRIADLTGVERHDAAVVLGSGWRSEERRVGKECRRLCRTRWSPHHQKKKRRRARPFARTPRPCASARSVRIS